MERKRKEGETMPEVEEKEVNVEERGHWQGRKRRRKEVDRAKRR